MRQGRVTDWDPFHDAFKKPWATQQDGGMLLDKFIAAVKIDKETITNFVQRFHNLLGEVPDRFKPFDAIILDGFIKGFHGNLTYVLKDNSPQNLVEAQKFVIIVEQNVNVARIDMFHYPRAKVEPKPKLRSQDDLVIQAFSQKNSKFTIEITLRENGSH